MTDDSEIASAVFEDLRGQLSRAVRFKSGVIQLLKQFTNLLEINLMSDFSKANAALAQLQADITALQTAAAAAQAASTTSTDQPQIDSITTGITTAAAAVSSATATLSAAFPVQPAPAPAA